MTGKELSQLYYLNKEIAQYEDRLELLRAKVTRCTYTIDGLPRGSGERDRMSKYVAAIVDLQIKTENAKQQRVYERDKIIDYIESTKNSLTRQILNLRCTDCLSWEDIAEEVGGSNTPDGVRQRFFREIKSRL